MTPTPTPTPTPTATPTLWAVGHLTVDDVVFPDGRTQIGCVGGAALYAALGARFADVPSTIVSRLGDGFPDGFTDRLSGMGIGASTVRTATPAIHQWVLYEADGSRSYVLHPDSGSLASMSPRPLEHPVPSEALVHIAPMPVEDQSPWCASLAASGHLVTLDPHEDSCALNPAAVLALVPQVHAFLPSEIEASRLASADPEEAVRAFRSAGADIAVVKLGEGGSVVASADGIWLVPALRVTARDVTGAGDTYCGAFAAALARGSDALTAARWATAAASFVVEVVGADVSPGMFACREAADRRAAVTPIQLPDTPSEHPLVTTMRNENA